MGENDGELGFKPPHPGEYLREDILPEIGMTITELAGHLGVSRNSASRLIHEKAAVSLDMAMRLGKAFKNGARFWMALQMQHDLWEREREAHINVAPIPWPEHDAA